MRLYSKSAKTENWAAVVLLSMARAFHVEDDHPLDLAAEAAVVQIPEESRPLGPWIVWQGGAATVCL
jgi:hypothetical protein